MSALPIDPMLLAKRSEIPSLIAQLSYLDQKKAIEFLRIWGEKRMPITTIHGQLKDELKEESA